MDEIRNIIGRLKTGARRALLKMTGDWQFAGRATFNANGAHSLFWSCGGYRDNQYVECESRKDGKWSRTAYRLTAKGLALQAELDKSGE